MPEQSVLKQFPKVELHLHLDGCLSVESAYKMIREMPETTPYSNMSLAQLKRRMVVERPLSSQQELLQYFQVPILALQTGSHLQQAYYELCRMKAEDHVCYCEVRFAPALHTIGGLSLDDVIRSVLEGKRQGERDFDILTNIIVVGLKDRSPEENIEMLETAAQYRNEGVTAVDCAGVEENFSILRQRKFLKKAKEMGFPVTFHCGEILESLNDFLTVTCEILPSRIAHGTTAVYSPVLCQVLQKHQIMLDICPTSNLHAGLYRHYSDIPYKQLKQLGIPVSISTDDTVLSDITMTRELKLAADWFQLSIQELANLNLQAMAHSFASNREKETINQMINTFLKGVLH